MQVEVVKVLDKLLKVRSRILQETEETEKQNAAEPITSGSTGRNFLIGSGGGHLYLHYAK